MNQKGFNLVELMVGGAMLVGVGLGGMTLFKNRGDQQSYLSHLRQLQNFHASLTEALQNVGNCNATFRTWSNGTMVPGSDIKELYLCKSGVVGPNTFTCGEETTAASTSTQAGTKIITEFTAGPADNSEWIPKNLGALSDRSSRSWRVKDMAMSPVKKTGRGTLFILYELFPNSKKPKTVRLDIPINFQFTRATPTRFVSCFSEKQANVQSTLQQICESMQINMNPDAASPMATWDPAQNVCLFNTNAGNCNFNNTDRTGVFSSLTKSGTACKSVTSNIDASTLVDHTNADCSGSKLPYIDLIGNGKMKMKCQ